jgi:probable F420-dependent oxidoreductase
VTEFGVVVKPRMDVVRAARIAERLGFDYFACGEHVALHGPAMNAFVALAVAAGATERIRLLSSVTLLPLYQAALAAKLGAELATHSGGRFEIGVGVGGDFPREFEACGVKVADRDSRTDEALEVIGRLWREDNVSFAGRFNRFEGVTMSPKPSPPPRIWIGGRKSRAQLRAARYGDVWMPYLYTPEQLRESVTRVRGEADRVGREPSEVRIASFASVCFGVDRQEALTTAARRLSGTYNRDLSGFVERFVAAGTTDDCEEQLRAYEEAGAERFIISLVVETQSEWEDAAERLAAELFPRFPAPAPRED